LGLLAPRPCCAAAYDMQIEMSSSPAGDLRLPSGKQVDIIPENELEVK